MIGALEIKAPDPTRIAVVQISDTHLLQNSSARLLGVPTGESLRRVLLDVRRRYPEVDLIVHTGDVAQDAHPDSYRNFSRLLQQIDAECVCIPGNHDHRAAMTDVWFPGSRVHINRSVRAGNWLLIALDTLVANADYGCLSAFELQRLRLELLSHSRMPTLIFLHHPPVNIGSAWMDSMALRHPETLLEIVDAQPQVRALAWGHNHQVFDTRRNRVRLLGAPATCFQYQPGGAQFAVDAIAPGYRIFLLRGDGEFDTDIIRVPHAWFPTAPD